MTTGWSVRTSCTVHYHPLLIITPSDYRMKYHPPTTDLKDRNNREKTKSLATTYPYIVRHTHDQCISDSGMQRGPWKQLYIPSEAPTHLYIGRLSWVMVGLEFPTLWSEVRCFRPPCTYLSVKGPYYNIPCFPLPDNRYPLISPNLFVYSPTWTRMGLKTGAR